MGILVELHPQKMDGRDLVEITRLICLKRRLPLPPSGEDYLMGEGIAKLKGEGAWRYYVGKMGNVFAKLYSEGMYFEFVPSIGYGHSKELEERRDFETSLLIRQYVECGR